MNANPGDFQERIRLVTILQRSGRQDQAETELRKAVDLSKSDPDRWISLVRFMVLTKQAEKAEKAIEDAQSNLPKPKAPLALARCCEEVGRLYEGHRDKALVVKMKRWYAEAKKWYGKAQEAAKPDDLRSNVCSRSSSSRPSSGARPSHSWTLS